MKIFKFIAKVIVCVAIPVFAMAQSADSAGKNQCGVACKGNQYCSVAPGQCGNPQAKGECKLKPQGGCPLIKMPVCGCDGQTYPNKCVAEQNGVNIASSGACKPTGGMTPMNNSGPWPFVAPMTAEAAKDPGDTFPWTAKRGGAEPGLWSLRTEGGLDADRRIVLPTKVLSVVLGKPDTNGETTITAEGQVPTSGYKPEGLFPNMMLPDPVTGGDGYLTYFFYVHAPSGNQLQVISTVKAATAANVATLNGIRVIARTNCIDVVLKGEQPTGSKCEVAALK
jgi:hypothetical protein